MSATKRPAFGILTQWLTELDSLEVEYGFHLNQQARADVVAKRCTCARATARGWIVDHESIRSIDGFDWFTNWWERCRTNCELCMYGYPCPDYHG